MAKPSQLQNMASVTLRQMQNHRKATHLGWAPTHPTVEAAYLFQFNAQQYQQGRRIRRGGKRNGISISGSEESGIVTAMSWLDLPWVRQGMTSNIFPTFGSRPNVRKWKVYIFSAQIHRCNLQKCEDLSRLRFATAWLIGFWETSQSDSTRPYFVPRKRLLTDVMIYLASSHLLTDILNDPAKDSTV